MSKILSSAVRIFKDKSPDLLQQAINDHLKKFDGNPAPTTIDIKYAIAEETVSGINGDAKKELIYSALLHITVSE